MVPSKRASETLLWNWNFREILAFRSRERPLLWDLACKCYLQPWMPPGCLLGASWVAPECPLVVSWVSPGCLQMIPDASRWFRMLPDDSRCLEMTPDASRWLQMPPDGFRWLQMTPDDTRWLQMLPDDSRWLQMIPDGSRWLQLTPDPSRWLQMPPDEARWLQMIPDDCRCLQMTPDDSRWRQMPPASDHSQVTFGLFHERTSHKYYVGSHGGVIYMYEYMHLCESYIVPENSLRQHSTLLRFVHDECLTKILDLRAWTKHPRIQDMVIQKIDGLRSHWLTWPNGVYQVDIWHVSPLLPSLSRTAASWAGPKKQCMSCHILDFGFCEKYIKRTGADCQIPPVDHTHNFLGGMCICRNLPPVSDSLWISECQSFFSPIRLYLKEFWLLPEDRWLVQPLPPPRFPVEPLRNPQGAFSFVCHSVHLEKLLSQHAVRLICFAKYHTTHWHFMKNMKHSMFSAFVISCIAILMNTCKQLHDVGNKLRFVLPQTYETQCLFSDFSSFGCNTKQCNAT